MDRPEFDPEKIASKLYLSERKRQVWGWVGEKAVGYTFYIWDAASDLGMAPSTTRLHLLSLEELELVARQQLLTVGGHLADRPPYEKQDHFRWPEVTELVETANASPRPPRLYTGS